MKTRLSTLLLVIALLPAILQAEELVTAERIQAVIDAVDRAAQNRDVQGIGQHLSDNFKKDVDIPDEGGQLTALVPKQWYLQIIQEGWDKSDEYSYTRQDTHINIADDGMSGESRSTILETVVIDGKHIVSRIREYARYALENGRVVITGVESHKLAGDTTPR